MEEKYAEELADEADEEAGLAEPEDDEARYDTAAWQKDFLKILPMLRTKDPKVYEKDTTFFDAADGLDEQARLKAAFADAAGSDDEGDEGLLRVKEKTASEQAAEDAAYAEWQARQAKTAAATRTPGRSTRDGAGAGAGAKKPSGKKDKKGFEPRNEGEEVLMRFWKDDAQLDDADRYLRKYIWNRMWLDADEKAAEARAAKAAAADSDADDDAELDREDDFERAYNFRFEEPQGSAIVSYPRQVPGSLRVDKKATRRAEKRRERRARKEQEKIERRAEFERLKALQREQIRDRVRAIEDVLGTDKLPFDMEEFEKEDFDPDKWSKQMDKLFDDDFYSHPDAEKPVFEPDEYLDSTKPLGRPEMDTPPSAAAAAAAAAADAEHSDGEDGDDDDDHKEEDDKDEDEEKEEKKDEKEEGDAAKEVLATGTAVLGKHLKKKAKKLSKDEAIAEARAAAASAKSLIDQYYTLDFEDMIGDMPCRFHYTEVEPDRSGLTVSDVLEADDDELAKIVPIRSIATYIPPEEQITRAPIPAIAELHKRLVQREQEERENAEQGGPAQDTKPARAAPMHASKKAAGKKGFFHGAPAKKKARTGGNKAPAAPSSK